MILTDLWSGSGDEPFSAIRLLEDMKPRESFCVDINVLNHSSVPFNSNLHESHAPCIT